MKRRISAHSSCCSARTAPTRRIRASRPGKMPTTSVRRRISRLSRWGVAGPDLPPDRLREHGEGQDVGAGGIQVDGHLRQFVFQRVQDAAELGVHGGRVGLVIDRVQQRPHPAPRGLRGHAHEIRGVMSAASLPAGPREGRADRLDQPAVRVAGDQGHASQATGG
jgi:hypothetical protein